MTSDTAEPSGDSTGADPPALELDEPAVEFDDTGRSTGVEAENTGERDRTPFDPERIEVQPRNTTVSLVLQRIRRGAIELAPDFQRRSGIWTQAAQSRLIESLLLRIALPTFYAAEGDDDSWAVVDGVQRLTTIARFVDPEAIGVEPLRLSNLEYLNDYDGCMFADLPGRLQTRILETELVILLIRRGTPEEAKFNIFARINTGGLPLSRQELRHALIPGRARRLLAELAANPVFQDATGKSVSPDRMADREMCLRYLAFTLTPPERYDAQDFDDFLRNAMHQINRLSDGETEQLKDKFFLGVFCAGQALGPDAFRKLMTTSKRRPPINKALFEAEAVTFYRFHNDFGGLYARADMIRAGLTRLVNEDPQFFDSISSGTGDPDKVNYRFQTVKDLFQEVLNA